MTDNITPLHPDPEPESEHVFVDVIDGKPVKYFRFSAHYEFDGRTWGIDFFARDMEEAKARLVAIGTGELYGQVFETIPA